MSNNLRDQLDQKDLARHADQADHSDHAGQPGHKGDAKPQSSSRRAVLVGAAATAGLAGAGLAWWRTGQTGNPDTGAGQLGLGPFWALDLPTPSGPNIQLASLKGRPLLLNFWATWCPPCVEELPLIDRFYQKNAAKGWQVLGLAVDQLGPVKAFLSKAPVTFQIAMSGLGGVELSKSLGNLSGGLPFTVVIGSQGDVLHRKMGQVTPADLTAWATLR